MDLNTTHIAARQFVAHCYASGYFTNATLARLDFREDDPSPGSVVDEMATSLSQDDDVGIKRWLERLVRDSSSLMNTEFFRAMAKYLECDVSNALITPESVAARFGPAAAGATTDATIWFVEGLFGMRDSDGPLWLANDPSLGKPRLHQVAIDLFNQRDDWTPPLPIIIRLVATWCCKLKLKRDHKGCVHYGSLPPAAKIDNHLDWIVNYLSDPSKCRTRNPDLGRLQLMWHQRTLEDADPGHGPTAQAPRTSGSIFERPRRPPPRSA